MAQEVDYEVNHNWTAVLPIDCKKIRSEASKVSTKELKEQVLSPNEPSANIECIARRARRENTQETVPDLQQKEQTRS